MLSNTIKKKGNSKIAEGYKEKMSLQPVVFITINPDLENVAINSPMSSKAEAAKKMFASAKH